MDRIKVVVVGLNFGGWVIENELLNGSGKKYIELAAVCDLDQEKVDEFSSRYHVKGYVDYQQALSDEDIQAVVLVTGPSGRAKLIDAAICKGKPVMTTKPFDTSSVQTLEVLRKARRLNIPVFMNSPTPVPAGEIRQIMEWIGKYQLGRPVGYRASTWCAYREKADGSWYDDPALCPAAPIYRLGVYLLNDLQRFLSPVREVQVLQSRLFTGRPTSDNAQLSILHEDGTIGSVFASFCIDDLQYYRCSIEMNFENGTVYKNVGPMDPEDKGKVVVQVSAKVEGSLRSEKAYFENSGPGYQWDVFYKAFHGEDVGETISPESVASVIRIFERMKEQSI